MNGYAPIAPTEAETQQGGLYLPGVVGNYASTPDAAALDITGSIDLRVRVKLDDWTSGNNENLISKYSDDPTGYMFRKDSANRLRFSYTVGAGGLSAPSTVAPTVPANGILSVRVTWNAATGEILFYTSADGVTWTQLGDAVSGSAGTLDTNTTALKVGDWSDDHPLQGIVYSAEVRDGIDGTIVAAPVFEHPVTKWGASGMTMWDGHRVWTLAGDRLEWK